MAPLFKPKSKSDMDDMPSSSSEPKSLAMAVGIRKKKKTGHAPAPMSEDEADVRSMVEQIMKKRKMADGGMVDSDKLQDSMGLEMDKMSDGGMVDLDHNGTESENMFDELSEDALKENYEDSELSSVHEPMDSKGDDLKDADAHSMVESIRRKMMSKSKG